MTNLMTILMNRRRGSRPRAIVVTVATVATAVLVMVVGCRADHEASPSTGGTLVISTSADADNLLPPLTMTDAGRQVTDQIFDYLADIGPGLNTIGDVGFRPRLARSWTWAADSLSIAFHLDPRARWHDGVPVTASDVAFTYGLVTDTATGSPVGSVLAGASIDSVSAPDPHTAVVWFHSRSPEQFYTFVYNLAILPAHLVRGIPPHALASSSFARHPVGSGRFRFGRWEAGSRIVLVADSANYRGRPRLDRVIWTIAPDPTTAMTRFRGGEADVIANVAGPDAAQVAASPRLRLLTMPGLDYGYLGFNVRRPPFNDPVVRRALTLAVDRAAMVRNVFDSLAVPGIGPVTRAVPAADTSARMIPFDADSARRLLAGRPPVSFTMLVPTTSPIRVRYATLLQEAYRRVGVHVTIRPLGINAFMERLVNGDFDAMLNAWHTDPSPAAVAQAWGAADLPPGGANFTRYDGAAFQSLLDSAARVSSPEQARVLYRRAYAAIDADAPAVWLYEPRFVLGLHRRVVVSGVRPDAWWADLADWRIVH